MHDIVHYWPGSPHGFPKMGRVISDGTTDFGGTPCYRIRKADDGTDYIAATHVELLAHMLDDVAYVRTAQNALLVCDLPGVAHVVVEDRAENIKLQRLIRGLRLA